MSFKLIGFIVVCIFVYFLLFNQEEINPECNPPYKILKDYNINSETHHFSLNNENFKFAIINQKCKLSNLKDSKDIYENYFTFQYASVIDKTPERIYEVKDATEIILKLVEKPYENVNNDEIDKLNQALKNFLREFQVYDEIKNLDNTFLNYELLHSECKNSLKDNNLNQEEIENIQLKTSRFIYYYLDETNRIEEFANKFNNNFFIGLLFDVDGFLKNLNFYKKQRDKLMINQIREILFKMPINTIYEKLNEL